MSTNCYGLDARYFKQKLGQLARDADNYTPSEMKRALFRLSDVAAAQETPDGKYPALKEQDNG